MFRAYCNISKISFCLIALAVFAGTACGYRLGARPCRSLMSVQTVEIPLFENLTLEPRVENTFTSAFRRRLQTSPCLSLRAGPQAEAILKGKILTLESNIVAVDQEFLSMEYSLRIELSLSLLSNKEGKIIWSAEKIKDEIRFYASSGPLLYKDNREEALMKLSQKMAERVLDQMIFEY